MSTKPTVEDLMDEVKVLKKRVEQKISVVDPLFIKYRKPLSPLLVKITSWGKYGLHIGIVLGIIVSQILCIIGNPPVGIFFITAVVGSLLGFIVGGFFLTVPYQQLFQELSPRGYSMIVDQVTKKYFIEEISDDMKDWVRLTNDAQGKLLERDNAFVRRYKQKQQDINERIEAKEKLNRKLNN